MYYLMAISSIVNKQKSQSNILLYIFGIIGVGLVVYFGGYIISHFGDLKAKSGVNIEVLNSQADVYLNDKYVGNTPFTSGTISSGTNKVTLKSGGRQYETSINFLPNDKGVVHYVGIVRDLGTSDTFSSGQEFWFEKDSSGNVLRVITDPSGANVSIDNSQVGTTPFLSSSISDGDYELKVEMPGYESVTSRISTKKGYTLNATFKLFPAPVNTQVKAFDGTTTLFNLSSANTVLTSNTADWAKAVVYWNTTRGINIESTGPNKSPIFDYFLDYKGNMFDKEGATITSKDQVKDFTSQSKIGYLGQATDGAALSAEAKQALETQLGSAVVGKQAKIKTTPTGWLRVRSNPNLSGTELTRVDAGGTYAVLEQQTGWVKIKVSDTVSGWISSDYVEVTN